MFFADPIDVESNCFFTFLSRSVFLSSKIWSKFGKHSIFPFKMQITSVDFTLYLENINICSLERCFELIEIGKNIC